MAESKYSKDETISCEQGKGKASIALIGAGWWSQGWHLPHLSRNENVSIAAIVDTSHHPKSSLNPHLVSLVSLSEKYGCPFFHSVSELIEKGPFIDGVIICTPHATHYRIGKELLEKVASPRPAPFHILMEKPMTTNVQQAILLHQLVTEYQSKRKERAGCFMVNHSANFRTQARVAKEVVQSGKIGTVRHVTAFFASPLSWIFDDPAQKNWNEPDDEMIGNGFAWGQSSHLLSWIYHVCGNDVKPKKVFCTMDHSEATGADISHSATIICQQPGVNMSISGTTLLPGNAHSEPPVAKQIRIKIFGTEGAIIYTGNDRDSISGKLELRKKCGSAEIPCDNFLFENLDQDGTGPESLQSFIDACLGREDYYIGADSIVGMRSVQTIDAMYRSNQSGNAEDIIHED